MSDRHPSACAARRPRPVVLVFDIHQVVPTAGLFKAPAVIYHLRGPLLECGSFHAPCGPPPPLRIVSAALSSPTVTPSLSLSTPRTFFTRVSASPSPLLLFYRPSRPARHLPSYVRSRNAKSPSPASGSRCLFVKRPFECIPTLRPACSRETSSPSRSPSSRQAASHPLPRFPRRLPWLRPYCLFVERPDICIIRISTHNVYYHL
ncbi:hypothetical protein B0H19DRAFT_1381117 [Mycena capillaripes]|nr:hypothetical protein B0H19DRAFT_1381117 [Mycena capillaripes]